MTNYVVITPPSGNGAAAVRAAGDGLSEAERGSVKFARTQKKDDAPKGKAKAKKSYFADAKWASRIKKRKPMWLWKGRLYRRAVNILTGDPGVGKSTLVCEIVAAFSTGRKLPGDAEPREPMNCMIMSSEDFADDTIVWRLEHQGANLSRIRVKDTKVALTKKCLEELEETVGEDDIKFVIIDTLTSWMGKDVDLNQTNEVSDWMNPLRDITKRTGCTFLLLRHVTKQASKGKKKVSMHDGIGSVALTGGARSELLATLIGKDEASKTTFGRVKRIKANVGFDPEELFYAIAPHKDPRNEHGVLRWVDKGKIPTNPLGKGEAKQTTNKPLGVKPEVLEKIVAALKRASPGTVSRKVLVGAAGTSASTVDRGLKQLIGAGKVTRVGDGQFTLVPSPQVQNSPSSSSSRHTPKGGCDELMMTKW